MSVTALTVMALQFPDFDPALFTISIGDFEFSLRWYALAYIAGLLLGWFLMVRLMKRPRVWPGGTAPMTPAQPEELLTWMVIGVILGGRMGYVLFYDLPGFMENPLEIFALWHGGMSFHGGFAGVILGTIFFCRRKNLPLLQVADAVALAAPTGLLFGRLANFVNGELWGRVTDVSWGMVFPTVPEQFWVNGENLPRHPSQLYEAALEGLLLGAVMWAAALLFGALKRPGTVTGMFFIGYGLARSFVELFRQWDPQLSDLVAATGLTMGQWLSLPMIAIGIGFIVVGRRLSRAAA